MSCHIPPTSHIHRIAKDSTEAIVRDIVESCFQARRCRWFDFLLNGRLLFVVLPSMFTFYLNYI